MERRNNKKQLWVQGLWRESRQQEQGKKSTGGQHAETRTYIVTWEQLIRRNILKAAEHRKGRVGSSNICLQRIKWRKVVGTDEPWLAWIQWESKCIGFEKLSRGSVKGKTTAHWNHTADSQKIKTGTYLSLGILVLLKSFTYQRDVIHLLCQIKWHIF